MRHRNGMSLIGMLVALAIVVIVVAMMSRVLLRRGGSVTDESLPEGIAAPTTLAGPLGRAQNVQCITNLRAIGLGVASYKASNRAHTPVLRKLPSTDAGVNAAPTPDTVTDEKYAENNWSQLGDQGMQNVWLMLADNTIPQTAFKCPGDAGYEQRTATATYGWSSPTQYSYSIQWPYGCDANREQRNLAAFTATLEEVAVFADRSPGGPVDRDRAPSNHSGTNVLWASGSVQYFGIADRSTVGHRDDEIYTNAKGVAGGIPQGVQDTSLTLTGRADD